MASPIISVKQLHKTYDSGFSALKDVNLDIQPGEIFALLGPNGAGKTTLISMICGIVNISSGNVSVCGFDAVKEFRQARKHIGLVPQELAINPFETPWDCLRFSRGLFGKPKDNVYLEQVLKDLALFEKRKSPIATLSGGMKRRVLIGKALAHQPQVLFLDEPSAGVDVELRREMWAMVKKLRENGTTVILTTHYIEEAEEMADRIGVINKGSMVLVEEKRSLIQKLGKKHLTLNLNQALIDLPEPLQREDISLQNKGRELIYTFNSQEEVTGIPELLRQLNDLNIEFNDLHTKQSSLEEIFVNLVKEQA